MDSKKALQKALVRKIFNDNLFLNEVRKNNYIDYFNKITNNNMYDLIQNIYFEKNINDQQDRNINALLDEITNLSSDYDSFLSLFDIRYLNYINDNDTDISTLLEGKKNAAVMSIDIRKSTELMLKSDNSESFSVFISELVEKLMVIIRDNYGVIEKFTGDGVLAFFPDFYTGEDCCCHAINASIQCHKTFDDIYNKNASNFIAMITNTGLGIGIDYGEIIMKKINNTINIIGKPVVYACRMGGIEAKKTAVNTKVYEKIYLKYRDSIFYPESIDLKTGEHLRCYSISSEFNNAMKPNWS